MDATVIDAYTLSADVEMAKAKKAKNDEQRGGDNSNSEAVVKHQKLCLSIDMDNRRIYGFVLIFFLSTVCPSFLLILEEFLCILCTYVELSYCILLSLNLILDFSWLIDQ